jgi:hypothetical protein
VVTNTYLAQYGPNPGASINVITKSGTRDFHGTAYWFNRNEAYNANDFFANRGGVRKQPYRFNNYGVTIGGPVAIPHVFNSNRSKLFFFFSTEVWQSRIPASSISYYTVPTALERQGNFSQSVVQSGALEVVTDPTTKSPFPGNIIPASRVNPNGQGLLDFFPLPNALNTSFSLRRRRRPRSRSCAQNGAVRRHCQITHGPTGSPLRRSQTTTDSRWLRGEMGGKWPARDSRPRHRTERTTSPPADPRLRELPS